MSISTKIAQKKAPSNKSVFRKQVNNKNSSNKQISPVQDILTLHQTIGNQAVQRLFDSGFIQGKLTVGEPNDKYEQEADEVADKVMRMPEPQVQRQSEEEEEMIQPKPIGNQITPLVQRQVEEEEEELLQVKSEGQTPQVTPNVESKINTLQGGGNSLSKETRNFFEPRFGQDFSSVRVHTDSNANYLARSINARAFTKGNNIVFGGGEYSPGSSNGKRLLGHELTHVMQQNRKKINRSVVQKKENNTGLPDNPKSGIESLSGHSMDDVKVHYNSPEPAQLNAHAFAKGSDIHLASGADKYLPHEAWHVVQQKQGRVQPTKQLKGKVDINDDEGLEREADIMGNRALQMKDDRKQYKCLVPHESIYIKQNAFKNIQRKSNKNSDENKTTSGELAWEIFKPTLMGAIRSLAPGILTSTKVGLNYKEVISIVDTLESSVKKITDYEKKIKKVMKGNKSKKFALKSLGKVNRHFQSIPNALNIDSENIIKEASNIVSSDMFTNMLDAVTRLQSYMTILNETKRLRYPYRQMISKLTKAEVRIKASLDALSVLEDALLNLTKHTPLPVFQTMLFSQYMTVNSYHSDVGTILYTVKNKRKGYERAIAASVAMEAYIKANANIKKIEKSYYREPKDTSCLKHIKNALPALKKSSESIYEKVFIYSECTFENIMDSLDFLPIEDSDGFFAVTSGLSDAYPNKKQTIVRKENRYIAGLKLYIKLTQMRPKLEKIEKKLNPIIMPFIYQEYYRFGDNNSNSLLSNYKFTYTHQIKRMMKNTDILIMAILVSSYFETR